MRVLFMGTPANAVPALEALLQAGLQVVGVVCRPDRPAGRGRKLVMPPVKQAALGWGLTVLQPKELTGSDTAEQLTAMDLDAIAIAAYGLILPPAVLETARLGCLNLHPSLLPRHRGPAPVVGALLEGDTETGSTIMLTSAGVDSGPVLAQQRVRVLPEDTAESLTDRLFARGAPLLAETMKRWARGEVTPQAQDHDKATYTNRVTKTDGEMNFALPSIKLWRQVRAYSPWPGAYTYWRGKQLKLLEVVPAPGGARSGSWAAEGKVGMVISAEPSSGAQAWVVVGDGLLGLRSVHLEGRRPVSAGDFSLGQPGFIGACLPDQIWPKRDPKED
jgi:methionyl-tRNA formyltransferase